MSAHTEKRYAFAHPGSGETVELLLTPEDAAKFERGYQWGPKEVTCAVRGKVMVRGAACGAGRCFCAAEIMPPKPEVLEIAPMLVLSTSHLTELTCNTYLPAALTATWQKGEYGWFVYVVENDVENTLPGDLRECMEFARKHGCFWIMFDCDGTQVSDLPSYDW